MIAIVKNIKAGTRVRTHDLADQFGKEMICFIGQKIKVEKSQYKNWYYSDEGWWFHKSWLQFPRTPQKGKK